MLSRIFQTFANCFKIPELRQRIIFTALLLGVARLIALVPQIDRQIDRRERDVSETPFGYASNERNLATFEADADGRTRSSSLPFSTTARGFSMAAALANAEALATVSGARTRFEIVKAHIRQRS